MSIGIWQLLIIAVIVILLFGRGKISDLMGDVAKGIKSFKKGMAEDDVPPPAPRQLDGQRAPEATPTPTAETENR